MRIFTISNQSRLYGEYISQACVLPRLMNCREIEPVSVLFRGPGTRSQIRGTRRNAAQAGSSIQWVMSGIRAIERKKQNLRKTSNLFGVKWRFRLLQSNVRFARVCWHDTRKTSALLTSSLFAILLFARGGTNQLATSGSLGHEIWIVYTKLKTWVSIKGKGKSMYCFTESTYVCRVSGSTYFYSKRIYLILLYNKSNEADHKRTQPQFKLNKTLIKVR